MKRLMLGFILAILMSSAFAGGLEKNHGKMGHSYHHDLYKKDCKSCHADTKLITDASCIKCHGTIDTIKVKSQLAVPNADPHNSFHYGKGASCLACHAEHVEKAPVCYQCHNSWFKTR